ncbi:TonB-dependent receptor [Novosphingobium sp. ERN07]|uniref:TonB-dependent siderophore receptor n=1 Tax=Novosphingobium sp. ERN07 TaxID=2726187 RepID=UPI00145723C8|nr:TonB-dependent receptor [Novosphingobium sp. ERN07]NLR73151.1 TonB-dependent receptor [Novosphingobium sp. ERN07]
MRTSFIALGCALASAAPAFAQEAPQASGWTPDVIVVTGARASYEQPDGVSATRTATPVEKVPQSVQSLTRKLIEDQDLQTLSDALVNVSGVVPNGVEQSVLQPTLVRGFAVNYYIDGVPTYQLPASVGDPGTLVNVERIDVAKGPTATLYGGGAGAPLSGIINLVSRDPYDRLGVKVTGRAGSFGTVGGEADVNLPIATGVALRVTGMIDSADSFIDFVSRDRKAIFPTLAVGFGSDTTLTVRGRYSRVEQTEYAGLPVSLLEPVALIDRNVYAGSRDMPRTWIENKGVTGSLTHRLSDRVEANLTVARAITGFEERGSFPFGQISGTVYNFGTAFLPSESRKTFATGSLTARIGDGPIRQTILVGVDYDATDYYGAMFFNPVWAVIDFVNPLPAPSFAGDPGFFFDQNDRLRSIAAFAQDQIAIGDRLDVTLGARWTRIKVRSNVGVTTEDTAEKITPRIGATLRLVDGLSLFGGYAEGFQGVVGGGLYTIVPKPETSQAWEGGFKFASPIKGLTGTASLYRITRQNVVTADPTIPFTNVQTGEQRAQGAELDLIYEPTPSFSLLFNYAYTDAKVTRDNTLPVGDRLRAVPAHSGRFAARYRFTGGALKGFALGGGVTAFSRRELTLPNTVSIKGLTLVDAQASYDLGPVSLGLSVANLLGSNGLEPYQYFGGPYVIPTQPRSAFLTLKGGF